MRKNKTASSLSAYGFVQHRLVGRGRRIRTLKNGFGDRHDTISSYPYTAGKEIYRPTKDIISYILHHCNYIYVVN